MKITRIIRQFVCTLFVGLMLGSAGLYVTSTHAAMSTTPPQPEFIANSYNQSCPSSSLGNERYRFEAVSLQPEYGYFREFSAVAEGYQHCAEAAVRGQIRMFEIKTKSSCKEVSYDHEVVRYSGNPREELHKVTIKVECWTS